MRVCKDIHLKYSLLPVSESGAVPALVLQLGPLQGGAAEV